MSDYYCLCSFFGMIGSLTLQTRIKALLATKKEVKDIQTIVKMEMEVEKTQNLESLRLRVASIGETRNLDKTFEERSKTED